MQPPAAPSRQAEVFAPGVISSGAHDSAPAFDRVGDVVYFGRSNREQSTIVVSTRTADGTWSEPSVASFSGRWNDMEPAMSPDGRYLVFVSDRPEDERDAPVQGFFNGAAQKGGRLWRIDRAGEGWSEPRLLPPEVNPGTSTFAPSIAADGTLYFMSPDAATGKFRLSHARPRGDGYAKSAPLPFSDGTATDVDPAVAPDQSFLVFGSGRIPGRGIDLFVVFRQGAGWTAPVPLGEEVNTPGSDAEPRIGVDGDLYFSSERVMPVAFPRTPTQVAADLQRLAAWDNGNYNIWRIPLRFLLDRARTAPR